MGVKGLWQLLMPSGRRISIETLSGKRLAIDASIWLTQFLKANRDPETGSVRAGAHLSGFIRRICKLLYHGILPVFVFDGATPEIKLREVRARRERREKFRSFGVVEGEGDDEGIKRMARRLLVSNLKKKKELEMASEKLNDGKKVQNALNVIKATSNKRVREKEDGFASTFNVTNKRRKNNENENIQKADTENENEKVDSDNDDKIINDALETMIEEKNVETFDTDIHINKNDIENDNENIDVISINSSNQNDDSSDESNSVELPHHEQNLDSDALVALPSNMRSDIIEKARRQRRMQSRREFMAVASDPGAYSQVQLKNFLRSCNLNKKIVEVGTKVANKDDLDGGLEGTRIASDASKRFILMKDTDEIKDKKSTSRSEFLNSNDNENSLVDTSSSDEEFESTSRNNNLRVNHRSNILVDTSEEVDSVGDGFLLPTEHYHQEYQEHDNYESDETSCGGGFIRDDKEEESRPKVSESITDSFGSINTGNIISQSNIYSDTYNIDTNQKMIHNFVDMSGNTTSDYDENKRGSDLNFTVSKKRDHDENVSDNDGSYQNSSSSNDDFEWEDVEVNYTTKNHQKTIQDSSLDSKAKTDIILNTTAMCNNARNSSGIVASQPHTLIDIVDDTKGESKSDDDISWEDVDIVEDAKKIYNSTDKEACVVDGTERMNTFNILPSSECVEIKSPIQNDQSLKPYEESVHVDSVTRDVFDAVEVKSSNEDSVAWEDAEDDLSSQHDQSLVHTHDVSILPDTQSNLQQNITSIPDHKIDEKRKSNSDDETSDAFLDEDIDSMEDLLVPSKNSTKTNDLDVNKGVRDKSHVDNANIIALKNAHLTASHLTSWAGRAVQKAIAQHLGSTDNIEPDESKPCTFEPIISSTEFKNDSIPDTNLDSRDKVGKDTILDIIDTSYGGLCEEDELLREDANRRERDMDTVTDEMKEEVILLLQLFGVPYMEAPSEAEAQCVALEGLGLVDGVVTGELLAFSACPFYYYIFILIGFYFPSLIRG